MRTRRSSSSSAAAASSSAAVAAPTRRSKRSTRAGAAPNAAADVVQDTQREDVSGIDANADANANANANANADAPNSNADVASSEPKTMAELELDRYIASQQTNDASNANSNATNTANSSSGSANKRRRTRSSTLSGVDYHRVRTSRLHRLEEMFWKDDTGYDSEDDEDNGDLGESGDDDDEEEGDGSDEEQEEESDDDKGGTNGNDAKKKPSIALNYGRRLQLQKIHDSPHIYVIDNFLTEGELKHMELKIADAERKKLFEKSFVDKGDGARRRKREERRKSKEEEEKKEDDTNKEGGKRRKMAQDDDAAAEEKKEDDDTETNGTMNGMSRSADAAPPEKKSTNRRQQTDARQRTSTFIHFGKFSDSKIASIETRAAELLQLPHICIEPLQLIKYQPGQYFKEHHDMGVLFDDGSVELPPRVLAGVPRRVVTILVYLNDLPEGAGGGTKFPYLSPMVKEEGEDSNAKKEGDDADGKDGKEKNEENEEGLIIHPKRGRAVVWCNIDQTGMPDPRTVHEGMPLLRRSKKDEARIQKLREEKALAIQQRKEARAKVAEEKKLAKAKAAEERKAAKKAAAEARKVARKQMEKERRQTEREKKLQMRPPCDQLLRSLRIPRKDPLNPFSSFGMKFTFKDGRTEAAADYAHPHLVRRCGLQLGRILEGDVVVSINGLVVYDVEAKRALYPFSTVISLMRNTKPGRPLRLDVFRAAPKKTAVEEQPVADSVGSDVAANIDAKTGCADVPMPQVGGAVDNNNVKMESSNDVAPIKNEEDDQKQNIIEINPEYAGEKSEVSLKEGEQEQQKNADDDADDGEESDEPEPELPLLKYAINIWACEE